MLRFHSLKVAELKEEAEDAVALTLEVPAELRAEYVGLPGQHVVVRAEVGGEEMRRTYSLVNAPGEWPLRIVARIHPAGRMTQHLAKRVKVGEKLDVLPPNGSFTPRLAAAEPATYVAFASGSGITPVMSLARALLATPGGNRFLLFYGNASSMRAMCLEELLSLKDRYLERLSIHFIMSREPQEAELYNGRIDGNKVREFARTLFKPSVVAEFFVCGPGNMIDEVSATLRELGVGPERIHGEHFTLATVGAQADAPAPARAPIKAPAAAARPGPAADEAEVTVIMDGRRRTFSMSRNAACVLDAAAEAGIELPFSCRAGVCSTCRTKVVSGEVEMAQNYALEEWEIEQGYVLACQSRVKSAALELDYDER